MVNSERARRFNENAKINTENDNVRKKINRPSENHKSPFLKRIYLSLQWQQPRENAFPHESHRSKAFTACERVALSAVFPGKTTRVGSSFSQQNDKGP